MGFSKPRCGAGDRCSDPLKGSYLKIMSASGAFDVDSDRIVAVGIRDVSMQNGYGPTGGTDHDDVSARRRLTAYDSGCK